ncbi:alpha/beta hydrolase [Neiella sp. HB171785]|uniref:Alpha/beta hydrolase n=1 Tax=Neiella litorisoli TaxID=2771431 RepID=A0A8J6QI63_9GAMM|nr:alpha/beta hydrolase [Neiella litorisoli]MBD1388286.1 alpha/beta hydrolase [Neiella litorisoli]
MLKILLLLTFGLISNHLMAADYSVEELELWQDREVPFNKPNIELAETLDEEGKRFTEISKPTIYLYRNSRIETPGPALLYVPGGGYARVAVGKRRSAEWAELFFDMGFAAVAVLKYRLPDGRIVDNPHQVPLIDAQQALAMLHRNATSWHIDRNKIGVKGVSAGGHLVASLNNFTSDIVAPDVQAHELKQAFSILRVPVITFKAPLRHSGSYQRLLGGLSEPQRLIDYFSMENQVSATTPPTFLVYATDDQSVSYQNSEIYAAALSRQRIPYKAVALQRGGHGFGLDRSLVDKDWIPEMTDWVFAVLADQ